MLKDSGKPTNHSSKKENLNKKKKQASILMALLPLSACGGGGEPAPSENPITPTPTPSPTPVPTPPPVPDFVENPTNVFIASDNTNSTFISSTTNANLTVTGKDGNDRITTSNGSDIIDGGAGNDIITSRNGNDTVLGGSGNDNISTGSGNDLIRAGEGRDIINAGSGNDVIVIVGTTSAGQYNNSDITNPAGSGTNLSDLITLANLNGRTTSEVVSGETIDGGTGTDTLFIYGNVDLTGVTLNNLTVLEVNSNVTLTADQISKFTKIDGDGTSTINIEVPPGDTYILDLSTLNLTDVGSLNISGDVKIIIDDTDDLSEINKINTNPSSETSLEIKGNGGTNTNVDLGDVADVISDVDEIEIDVDVTLIADNADDIMDLGLTEINGAGDIDTNGNTDAEAALDAVDVKLIFAGQDNYTGTEDQPIVIFIDDLLNNDKSENPGELTISNIALTSSSANNADIAINYELGTISVTPDPDYSGTINLTYLLTDSKGESETGNVQVSITSVSDIPIGYGSTAIINVGESRELSIDGKVYSGDFLISSDGERLRIDDVDSNNSNILIRVESISGGVIRKDGSPVTIFTYDDVANRRIEFDHNGSSSKPTLTLSFASDGANFGNPTDVHVSIGDINELYIVSAGGLVPDNFTIPLNRTYLLDGDDKFFGMNDVDGSIINNGDVISSGLGNLAPFLIANADTVTNNGHIEVSPSNGDAVGAFFDDKGEMINNGLITSQYFGSSTSINTTGIIASEVTNTGTIYVVGTSSVGVLSNDGLTLNNSGVIYVNGDSTAIGVAAASFTSNITNTGKVIVKDDSDTADSIGFDFQTSIATLNNSGYIEADIAIRANYTLDLTNSGDIYGDIELSAFSNQIENTGTIYGNITFGNADDQLTNHDGIIHGVIDGAGGNDILYGSNLTDYIYGGSGNDFIGSGRGGSDVFAGGSGDDIFAMLHEDFKKIDGGTGKDTYQTFVDDIHIDFNVLDASKIDNIEVIYLSGINSQLSIDAEHVIEITDNNNKIYVNGDINDTVNSNDNWIEGGTEVVDGITYQIYTSGNATLLINEDIDFNPVNNVPIPTISINDITANEADETDTFTVTLSEATTVTVTVDYTAPNGSNGTLTFNPGDTEKTFITSWTDDNIVEADETLNATLSNPSNATIADGTGQLTILNDDGFPSITIDDITASEADEIDIFTVSLSKASAEVITVDFTAPDGSFGTITFNPGETSKTFNTTWSDDNIIEANETGNAILSNPTNANITDGTGQLTILDDDAPISDFIESPANTFTAIDDNGRTLDEADNTNNLTVFGGAGNDIITTGSGIDIIDGGAGTDILNSTGGETTFIANQDDNSFMEDTFNGSLPTLDTLIVKGNSAVTPYEIDLADLNSVEIDRVVLDYNSSESLHISLDAFADMRENSNFIRFIGDDSDTISTSDDWQYSGVSLGYDEVYYRYSAQIGNNFYSLYVSMEIGTLDGFAAPTTAGFTLDAQNTYSAENDEESAFSMGQSDQDITITSGIGRTYIATGSGDDVIDASASSRANIISGAGDDTITGTIGRDYIRGSEGADVIDGGDDTDTVSYYRSQEGVTVNLSTGVNTGGYAEGDTLTNIEIINGSNFDDHLTGDDGDNSLFGERGDDTIYGLGGNDYIITSEGNDFASGGTGDDTFTFTEGSADFNGQFDGGADFDNISLRFSASSDVPWEVDISELDASNFEQIILEGGDGDQAILLTISVDDVLNITDENNTLYVTSNSFFNPSAHEINTASNWTYIQTIVYNGDEYFQYQSGGATLNIELSIISQNGFPMPTTNFTETDTNEFTAPVGKFGYFIDKENTDDLTLIAGDETVKIESGKGNDTITVEDSDLTKIDGGDGNDTITVLNSIGYESYIFGGKGNDTITGGGIQEGGEGADILNGSTTSPSTVAYVKSDAGITIDFINNTASGGHAEGDTLSNFSSLIGSDFDDHITLADNSISLSLGKGDDTIIGSSSDDYLYGSEGADTIDGGGDSFAGDTVDYSQSDEGITINLTTNTFSGGDAEGDTVTNVENFDGSYNHANHFTGDENNNQFRGGANDDTFNGMGGNDTFFLDIDTGNDIVDGGEGFDIFDTSFYGGFVPRYDFGEHDISNMEALNSSGSGREYVFTADDIVNMTDGDNKFIFKLSNDDVLSTTDTWTQGATEVVDGVTYDVFTSSSATILVNEDYNFSGGNDVLPTLSINDVSANESEENDTFTVTLSKVSTETVTVDYTAPDGSNGTLTFNPGDTQKTFTTSWTDDNTVEANEVVNATLTNPTNATIVDGSGQLTILDDDSTLPTISVNDIEAFERDETADFTITLSKSSSSTITVDYSFSGLNPGTITFNPGETQKTVSYNWTDDNVEEAGFGTSIILTNPTNATISDNEGDITILDDDYLETVFISSDIGALESAETASFTVRLVGAARRDISVDYSLTNGDSGTLNFAVGEQEKTITVNWTNDTLDEDHEIITATLSNPVWAQITNGNPNLDGTGILTITDDDSAPTISIDDISANEADETDTFTVSLSSASGKTITVQYLAPDGSNGTLTFNPGETEKTFTTSWTDDNIVEVNEIVNASLNNPTNATFADDTGQLTILDNDSSNNAPVANDDTANASENQVISVNVLANDTDADNDILTVTSPSVAPNMGSVAVVSNEIVFDPGTDFDYLDTNETVDVTVTYNANDDDKSDTGSLVITVTGENDRPTAVDDNLTIDANDFLIFDLFTNDYDAEGDNFSLQYIGGYQAVGEGNVETQVYKFFYDPETDFDYLTSGQTAEVDVSYRIQDSGGYGNVGKINITINGTDEGEDDDSFIFLGDDISIDLQYVTYLTENDFENIDMSTQGDHQVTLAIDDLIDFTDEDNTLKILGDSGDAVISTGQGWVQGSDQVIDSETYHTYTSGTATLLVDDDIVQTIT